MKTVLNPLMHARKALDEIKGEKVRCSDNLFDWAGKRGRKEKWKQLEHPRVRIASSLGTLSTLASFASLATLSYPTPL